MSKTRKRSNKISDQAIRSAMEKQQARAWGEHASDYEEWFVMPFESDVINPMLAALKAVKKPKSIRVADIGCGKGHLLEILTRRFKRITAIDFSKQMLDVAKKRLGKHKNIDFHQASMTDLSEFHDRFHLITATSSIVMPDPLDRTAAFRELRLSLVPGGKLFGIVPSMDSVIYHVGLAYHSARISGKDRIEAKEYAIEKAEAEIFDFTLGHFLWDGIRQKFYHPFEIEWHCAHAGFVDVQLEKVEYGWGHAAEQIEDFPESPPVWDWFFSATNPE